MLKNSALFVFNPSHTQCRLTRRMHLGQAQSREDCTKGLNERTHSLISCKASEPLEPTRRQAKEQGLVSVSVEHCT